VKTTSQSSARFDLDQLIDWFIPAHMMAEREQHQRARMFVLSHIFGPFLGNSLPLFMLVTGPADLRLLVLFIPITLFWAFLFLLKYWGHYTLLAIISLQNLNLVIVWGCFVYGGPESPFLPWAVNIPLLSFFYFSAAGPIKYWIMGMSAANFLVFCIPWMLGVPYPPANLHELQAAGIISSVSAAAYVAMMAFYYANILASQVDLENEVRRHQETATVLRRTTEIARRASAAKSEFVAKMSHELRTPLNAIIGYSQILLEDAQDDGEEMVADDLGKIQTAGQHLLRLVNDVLDFSKIEAGKMDVLPSETPLQGAMSEAAEAHRAAAESNGTLISVSCEPGLTTLRTDWSLARKALSHLIANAVKFTANGQISIRARRRADGRVAIEVLDTGVGIPAEAVSNLFNAFTVAGDVSASKYGGKLGGAGIGLALSGRVMALLGGSIDVESEEGEGSRFTLLFPAQAAETAMAA
jgi:signal transduction histidine kinase